MPFRNQDHSIKYPLIILVSLFLLNACKSAPEKIDDEAISTSVANTMAANVLQYTLEAQQAQLTTLAQTMTAPIQPPPPSIPTQAPPPQVATPPQAPSDASAQAASSILSTLGINATPSLAFGLNNGSLKHDPSDGSVSYECSSTNVKNFLVEVTFSPPYQSNVGVWDFGILFRSQSSGNYRMALYIGKEWELEYYLNATDQFVPAGKGNISSLKTNVGDANLVQLVGMENQGWLLVNGVQSAKFDLSGILEAGDVCIAIGFLKNTEIAGKETAYTGFTVWELK